MEGVVHADVSPRGGVDPVHVLMELGPVTIVIIIIVRHKEKGVNHFMEQSLDQVFSGS